MRRHVMLITAAILLTLLSVHGMDYEELRKGFDWYRPLAAHFADCYEAGVVAKYRDHLKAIGWPASPPA